MQQHVYTISQTAEQHGIKHAVVCPGSRSAPLVFAFTQNKNIKCFSVIDERSAAYIALGMAQQLQEPVVLICTSGTAALNFYPAIAEAYYQKIPLLVLTADRPPELLNRQDGQMIMQKNMYGKHVRADFELPNYLHGKENFKETAGIVSKAIQAANGLVKGPVHINVPLSEPLYPRSTLPLPLPLPFISVKKETRQNAMTQLHNDLVKNAWNKSKKKLILIGQYPVDNYLFTSLFELNKHDDVVILSDVLSNKQSLCTAPHFDFIVSQSDEKTLKQLEPDLLISLGGPVLSKNLKIWLKKQKPKYHFRIQQNGEQVDTYNNVTNFILANPAYVLINIRTPTENKNLEYKNSWKSIDNLSAQKIKSFLKTNNNHSELHAMAFMLKRLPDAINLHIANSSPVRYLSLLGKLNPNWTMNGNRGTSGIDGCTSTAVGAALMNNKLTVLITGDLGFLYDRNALWNQSVPNNLRIIVLNNFGGGIFQLIDGPSLYKEQLDYFTTPHQQSVKNTALDNGLDYYFCEAYQDLNKIFKQFFEPKKKAAVLELTFSRKENARIFQRFKKIKLV